MDTRISAIGFDLDEDQNDLILKKLGRIKYAEDLLVSLDLKVKEDKKYVFDVTVHFRWGPQAHISEENYEFGVALNKMIDVLDQKVRKEKDKIQEKGK